LARVNLSDILRDAQGGCAPSRREKHARCARKSEFGLAANYKFRTVSGRQPYGRHQQNGKPKIFEHDRFSLVLDLEILSNAEMSSFNASDADRKNVRSS